MKNTIVKTAKSVKKHVEENKFAYVASAVAVAAIALQQSNRVTFYKFLEEKGIDPEEYYCPEAYEEKQTTN
jgi:hypothetical protein